LPRTSRSIDNPRTNGATCGNLHERRLQGGDLHLQVMELQKITTKQIVNATDPAYI